MRVRWLAGLAGTVIGTSSAAQEVRPLADFRLRWENVEQDGLARNADAVTLRARVGGVLALDDWSLLAEAEATAAPVGRYDDGLEGDTAHPIVADPENAEINRFQVQYRGLPATVITAGRQRLSLDDQRFVGSVGWRQNEQTFDAVRLEHSAAAGVKADIAYAWSVRTIWGMDGAGARQQAVSGDTVLVNLAWSSPVGTLTGFAYLVDQDEAAVQGFRLSSQTYGVRLAGDRSAGRGVRLSYAIGHARQSDYRRNPDDYSASYWLAEAGIEASGFKLAGGLEVLGAGDRGSLTSFQTPLATLHKFQGWADKFLITPPNGVRDLHASAGYSRKGVGGLDLVSAAIIHHRFASDRLGIPYGGEWDAQLSARKGRWTVTAKFADYRADQLNSDTRKLWLQLEWAL